MNADPTRPMRRILSVFGTLICRTTCRSFAIFPRQLPSLHSTFCWALILTILLFVVSGCGRYKEELATAKQQIEALTADVKKLTEETASLKKDKDRLSGESKTLSDKNARMQRELEDLNRAKSALAAENKEIKQKNSAAEQEIASLKRENATLTQKIEELKKRVAETVAPAPLPATIPTETAKEFSPCDAVLAFMKASEEVIRQQRGAERTKSLEQVRQQYAPKMKGAPEKAIKAAENWVKEGAKFWDQTSDDSTFRLLQLRNTVLEACGKSPDAAGFK